MLTIFGEPQKVCSGPTRREKLQACGAGLFGASLPTVLAAEDGSDEYPWDRRLGDRASG